MSNSEKIVGRQAELAILEKFFSSRKAEFLGIYGRRRVGKTYLIRNFFKKKTRYFFNSTGIYNAPIERQLAEFVKEISRVFYKEIELKEKNNWFDAFELLTASLQKQVPKDKKIILFFDEFPWMATHRSKLLQALDFYWNRYWSQDKRIKLIICGSAASWIIKNIINNKGGLHNRLTRTMKLDPMDLGQTKAFLHNSGIKLNFNHIVQIYMVTGGIPYYLSRIDPGLSATQAIEALAFTKSSFLLNEFDNLYSSLFDDSEIYIEIVRAIAKKKYGLGQEELFNQIENLSKGGTVIEKLKELEDAGFLISFKPYGHKKKGIYYRVIDEYSLFYFDWIEPIKKTLLSKSLQKGYWQKIQKTANWHNWAGYAFEAICYKHLVQISKALSLSPTAIPNAWRHSPVKNSGERGAQIDLLFDRDDDAITIGEIKYTEQPFVIDKQYAETLKQKIEIFSKITRVRKQIFLAMISANGLKDTVYSEEMVSGVVTLEDLFKSE
ncbi:MAG: hypothetical protein K0Q74_676 [Gammaproteobacteria bacterium]|jgi:AAA+ ATPase superfamily predicted ATPase|nr:hypothetical protein [Gammaproteobacteria bacterium]